jgi:N-acetylmuramoyl-L-alanine amidase
MAWQKVVSKNDDIWLVSFEASAPIWKVPLFVYGKKTNVKEVIKALSKVEHDDIMLDKTSAELKSVPLPVWMPAVIFKDPSEKEPVVQDPKHSESNPTERISELLSGKTIVLDPGHSEGSPGARGMMLDYPEEEDMNRLQAQIIARRLTDAGARVRIFDPIDDDLKKIGAQAKGADMFISIHLNAYNANGYDEYGCVMVHRDLKRKADVEFAALCAERICKALDHRIFKGHVPKYPTGVYAAGLGVLRAAIGTGCPVCVLTEAFFIDDYGSNEIVINRSTKAAHAIADAVIEWFKK